MPHRVSNRPNVPLYTISEEIRARSAMLAAELQTWPGVCPKPMFGMLAFYRGRKIFAALPRTRALGSPSAVIFKLKSPSPRLLKAAKQDSRVHINPTAKAGWVRFEMESDQDITDALRWFDRAYQAAK